jgi:hypothetical protein
METVNFHYLFCKLEIWERWWCYSTESENLRAMDAGCVNTFLRAGKDWCPSSSREGIEDTSFLPPFLVVSPQHIGWCTHTLRRIIHFTECTNSNAISSENTFQTYPDIMFNLDTPYPRQVDSLKLSMLQPQWQQWNHCF